jgi:hypothetical protein
MCDPSIDVILTCIFGACSFGEVSLQQHGLSNVSLEIIAEDQICSFKRYMVFSEYGVAQAYARGCSTVQEWLRSSSRTR